MTKEFYTELAELIKKHKLSIFTGNPDNLVKTSKSLRGNMIFITNGEKVIDLQGGEEMVYPSSTTILMHKNRRK